MSILGGAEDSEDNCWLTAVIVDPGVSSWTASALAEHLAGAGIETRQVWKPMHLQPVCSGMSGTLNGTAQRMFETGVTLPSGSGMSEDDFERVEASISQFMDGS